MVNLSRGSITDLTVISATDNEIPCLKDMAFYKGNMFINGNMMNTAYKDGVVYWQRKNRNCRIENGALKLLGYGYFGEGVIECNGEKYLFQVTGVNKYTVIYVDSSGREKKFQLHIGVKKDESGQLRTFGKIITGDEKVDELIEKYNYAKISFSVSEDQRLKCSIDVDYYCCEARLLDFIQGEFTFSMSYETLDGYLYEYDENNVKGYIGKKVEVKGWCINENLNTLKQKYVFACKRNSSQDNHDKFRSSLPCLAKLENSIPLSVTQLFTLAVPSGELVKERTLQKILYLMQYYVKEQSEKNPDESKKQTYKQMLALFPPYVPTVGKDLSLEDIKLLNNEEVVKFIDKFALANIGSMLASSGNQEILNILKEADNYENKLKYYWSGDGETSLFKEIGFNIASSDIMKRVYGEATPGLIDYYKDDAEGWAKKLYDYCMQDQIIRDLTIQKLSGGTPRINHICSMIYFLYPDGLVEYGESKEKMLYAAALYARIVDTSYSRIITSANPSNVETFKEYINLFIQNYIKDLFDKSTKLYKTVGEEGIKELNDYMRDNGIKNQEELAISMNLVALEFIEFARLYNKKSFSSIMPEFFGVRELRSVALRNLLGSMVYAFGLIGCIYNFTRWDEMGTIEKIQSIATVSYLFINFLSDINVYASFRVLTNSSSGLATRAEAMSILEARGIKFGPAKTMGAMDTVRNYDIQQALTYAQQRNAKFIRLGTISEIWSTVSRVAAKIIDGIGIAIMLAGVVAAGFIISEDIKDGQPPWVIALDAINGFAMVIALGISVAALFSTAVAVVAPWIMLVVALVGVVIEVILGIFKKPTISPVQLFIRNTIVPFINDLKNPTAKWLQEQKELEEAKHHNGNLLYLA